MNVITIDKLTAKVSLGRSTIYRMVADGEFPQPFLLVPNRNAWIESEIDAWIAKKSGREAPAAILEESERAAACERLRLYLDRVGQLVDARVRVAATKSAAVEWIARARSEVEALDPIWARLDSFSSARS